MDVGAGGAIEDGELEIVEFDDDVVDAHADEGGEQVFGGGDEDALAHEAGGVGDLGDVATGSGDLEVVEVGAAEDDSGAGGGREQAHGDRSAAVEADAGEVEGLGDGLFVVSVVLQCYLPGRRTGQRLFKVTGYSEFRMGGCCWFTTVDVGSASFGCVYLVGNAFVVSGLSAWRWVRSERH